MMDWNDSRITFALKAVKLAANLAAEIQGEMVSKALTKDDRSPVTVADFAAQAVVGYYLGEEFPGEILVGEEQSDALRTSTERDTLLKVTTFVSRIIPGVTPADVCDLIDRGVAEPGDKYWTLDPIDGTKGFLRRAQYATALACVENGLVQLGVLGCPNISPELQEADPGNGSLLIACRGGGSWIARLNDPHGPDRFSRIYSSRQALPEQARTLRSFESSHTNTDKIDAFQEALGITAEPVRMDSQVKYALLASGKGEIYLRLLSANKLDYKEKIWDQAAGSIVIEEAGGRVTDLDGAPLDFSQGRTLRKNRGVCATNGILHAQVLEALRAVNA